MLSNFLNAYFSPIKKRMLTQVGGVRLKLLPYCRLFSPKKHIESVEFN